MRRRAGKWTLAVSLLLAGCSDEAELSVADDTTPSEESAVDETPETSAPTRFESGGLSCPTGLMEDGSFDFEENPEPVTAENTRESVAARFMSPANGDFNLRVDDWQLLELSQNLSTETRFVYIDGEGYPYLQLRLGQIGEAWLVTGFTTCTTFTETGGSVTITPAPGSFALAPTAQTATTTEAPANAGLLLSCGGFGTIDSASLGSLPPLLSDNNFPEIEESLAPLAEQVGGEPDIGEWRIAHMDDDTVNLISIDGGIFTFVVMERANDGGWDFRNSSSSEDCMLEVRTDDQLGPVDFIVESADPESSTVVVSATERSCASGQPMGDRLQDPQVAVTDDTILVILGAEPLEGDQDCQGNPSRRVEVDLGEPLGDRSIRDGREFGLLGEFWSEG